MNSAAPSAKANHPVYTLYMSLSGVRMACSVSCFCYLDWALYPVCPLCMALSGGGMVCFVVCFCVLILVHHPEVTLYMWVWGVRVASFFTILPITRKSHYTCEFRVMGLGLTPETYILHVSSGCYHPKLTLYMWVSGDESKKPGFDRKNAYDLFASTPFTHYTWDFRVALGVLGVLCFAYPDWAQYPVYTLYMGLWGIRGALFCLSRLGPIPRLHTIHGTLGY